MVTVRCSSLTGKESGFLLNTKTWQYSASFKVQVCPINFYCLESLILLVWNQCMVLIHLVTTCHEKQKWLFWKCIKTKRLSRKNGYSNLHLLRLVIHLYQDFELAKTVWWVNDSFIARAPSFPTLCLVLITEIVKFPKCRRWIAVVGVEPT